jgi:membrane dipeptidase
MPYRCIFLQQQSDGGWENMLEINRRELLRIAAASGFTHWLSGNATAAGPIYLADMHYHLFFGGTYTPEEYPLGLDMAGGQATLVAWSLVSDLLWMGPTADRHRQKKTPNPGEVYAWFQREMARIKRHVADQGLKIVINSADVDNAVHGDPHVVLATEGTYFLDEDLSRLAAAYEQGVRHVQLVHYLKNSVGDYQTEPPTYGGLTEFGKQVIVECNRLGILIDLAHCTEEAVTQALAITKAPMIWSHSSIAKIGKPNWSMVVWKARQLTLPTARKIAQKGGVVGLWALRPDVGPSVVSYADRLAEMADQLGEDHVAIGTDSHGMDNEQMLANYADVRKVIDYWQKTGMKEAHIRKIAIENYARVLKEAFRLRQPA